jgi:hypothetical protein
MAIIAQPVIDNLQLSVQRDVGNGEVTVEYDINWPKFAQLTDLAYQERVELVGVDTGGNTTLFVFPMLVNGISPNGNETTHRTRDATIDWDDLNEDPAGDDELAAVVTLTPLLPVPVSAQSPQVVVSSP